MKETSRILGDFKSRGEWIMMNVESLAINRLSLIQSTPERSLEKHREL
jgi:hypothetical protein